MHGNATVIAVVLLAVCAALAVVVVSAWSLYRAGRRMARTVAQTADLAGQVNATLAELGPAMRDLHHGTIRGTEAQSDLQIQLERIRTGGIPR